MTNWRYIFMTRRIYSLCIICLATFLMIICVLSCKKEAKIQKVSVRLKWTYDITQAGMWVAKEKGFFKEQGIDVTIHAGGFELDPVKLVASGSGDFGVTGSDNLLMARTKEIPIVAIGAEFQRTPICFMVMEKSNIRTPQDFVGKTVGVKYATDAETVYGAFLAKMGVDRKKIKEVPVKWDMTPFFTGQVDVLPSYVTNEPIVAAQKGYKVRTIKVEDHGMDFYGNVYFTTEKMIREKPELVQRFMNALVKGWEYALKNKRESIDILLTVGEKLDRDSQAATYDAMIPYINVKNGRVCWMDFAVWQDEETLLRKIGVLEKEVDLKKAVNVEFVKNAYSK